MTQKMKCLPIVLGLMLSSVALSDGTDGTKGGGYVIRDASTAGRPVLLDLFVARPGTVHEDDRRAGASPLAVTELSRVAGHDSIDVRTTPAYRSLRARLARWKANSPFVVGQIEEAIAATNFRVTPLKVLAPNSYHVPAEVRGAYGALKVEGVVLYVPELGPVISVPVWNEMGALSQEATLLHEGLRHMQIAYRRAISHQELQELTAKLMLESPTSARELDRPDFLSRSFGESIELRFDVEALRGEFVRTFCARVAVAMGQGREALVERNLLADLERIDFQACAPGRGPEAIFAGFPERSVEAVQRLGGLHHSLAKILSGLLPREAGYGELSESKDLIGDLIDLMAAMHFRDSTPRFADSGRFLSRVSRGIAEESIREILAGGDGGLDGRTLDRVKKLLNASRAKIDALSRQGVPVDGFELN